MSEILPPNRLANKRDVFKMLIEWPIENVTQSLRKGDAHELENLRPFANRCRALADAFDARMSEIGDLIE